MHLRLYMSVENPQRKKKIHNIFALSDETTPASYVSQFHFWHSGLIKLHIQKIISAHKRGSRTAQQPHS